MSPIRSGSAPRRDMAACMTRLAAGSEPDREPVTRPHPVQMPITFERVARARCSVHENRGSSCHPHARRGWPSTTDRSATVSHSCYSTGSWVAATCGRSRAGWVAWRTGASSCSTRGATAEASVPRTRVPTHPPLMPPMSWRVSTRSGSRTPSCAAGRWEPSPRSRSRPYPKRVTAVVALGLPPDGLPFGDTPLVDLDAEQEWARGFERDGMRSVVKA